MIIGILWRLTPLIRGIIRIGDGVRHGAVDVVIVVKLYRRVSRSGGIVVMIDRGSRAGRRIIGSEVVGRDAWHAGETQLAKVGSVEKGVVGDISLARGGVMVAYRV
jgi:hypothetical protein